MDKITIGGSEIAVVMGLSRFKTPLRLWAEKTGKFVTEDISGKEYVKLGNELEDFVARKFSRETGLPVRRDTKTFVHKDYPFAIGHIDRRITGTDAILECKTCSAWKAHEWEGEEIPQEYILQVMWYLGVTVMSRGYIAVLIGGQKFVWKEIVFDEALFITMVEAAKEFIEYCKTDTPPMAISGDSATLLRLYPEQKEDILKTDDEEINKLVGEIQAIKRVMNEADEEREEKEAKLKQIIGEREGVDTLNYRASWKSQIRKQIDFARLRADGLYDKYYVEKSTRILRIHKKKEKEDGN